MNRLENPCEITHLMFEEEAFFSGTPLNTLNSNTTTDCQHHSPHPSLGSFGEEVRCSLDELDAVIATYDDENNNHNHNNSVVDVNNCIRQLFTSPLTIATNSTDYSACSTFIPSSTSSTILPNQLSSTLQKNIDLLSLINQSNHSVITSKALPVSSSSLSAAAAATPTSVTTSMHFITSGTENTHHHHHNYNNGLSNGNEIRRQCKDPVQMNSITTGFNSSLQSFCTLTKHVEKTESSPPLPPPPDPYASENFTLPPPPLSAVDIPALPYSSNTVIRQDTLKSLSSQFNSPSNGYLNRQISDPHHEVDTSADSYCCTNNSRCTQSSNSSTNKSTTRPSIPQRAPSTRLTSVPNCSKQDLDTPLIENTKGLNAFCDRGNGTGHLIKTTGSCNTNPVKTPSEISSKEENDSIERTTLPVQDIIRKFGSLLDSNAKIPNQCYTSSCSQNVIPSSSTTTAIRSNDSLNTCQNRHLLQPDNSSSSSIKTSAMRKYNQPTTVDGNNSQNIPFMDNVNSSTKLGHSTNNGIMTPTVLASQTSTSTSQENHASLPSSSLMQVNQGINLSPEMTRFPQINNNNNNNNNNNAVKYTNLSPVFSTSFSPLLPLSSSSAAAVAPTSNVTNLHRTVESVYINRKIDNDRCDFNSTVTNFSSVSQTTTMHHTNTSTFLSSGNMSGGGLSKAAHNSNNNNNNKTNNSNHSGNNGKDSTLNHNPRVHHYQQPQHQQQLDSHVVHQLSGTLLQRRLSSDSTADSSSIVHVQSMNLDSNTLAIFNQFNIVDATQIPGYHSIPPGLPDWKTHRLERKNREAASLYAEELKKWGLVPNWKRELIEKKQLNKMDNHQTSNQHQHQQQTCPTQSLDYQGNNLNQSLATPELAEKLKRRLDKVSNATLES
uniref:Uncharacterized protein n=1 Tax=Trichobilharzia regenti TaxID=157069 RepID=A0AA85JMC0_TRIRE|nr:unnamed protein product [Trichobilharzia regenti]